jgi:hypothetical protein
MLGRSGDFSNIYVHAGSCLSQNLFNCGMGRKLTSKQKEEYFLDYT